MKNKLRLLSLLMAAVMVFSLAACTEEAPADTQPVILQSAKPDTSFEGVEIGLFGVDRTSAETTIQVIWKNNTDFDVLYGDVFWLQALEDGQWKSLETKPNTGFHTIGYSLKPDSSFVKNYTTSWIYGTLQPGTYRFLTNCHIYDTKEGTVCDLSVEFTLGTLPNDTTDVPNHNFQSPYTLPPQLQLGIGTASGSHQAIVYDWTYAAEGGQMVTAASLMTDPAQIKNSVFKMDTTMTEAVIDFADWPDELSIRCWSESAFGHPNSPSETVTVFNKNQFRLIPATSGGYIYEITATWHIEGSLHYGTAVYYVYIASYPITPIQPRN